MQRLSIMVAALALLACQKEPDPRAEQLFQEELAKVRGAAGAGVTLDAYEQLEVGSSYAEAAALLGEGIEAARSSAGGQDIVVYQWVRSDGGNISLTFNNDALVSKAQAGLT